MKWGDSHIGGPELGPVIFRYPEGNEPIAQKYIYQGRLLLGELKKQMQLGGLKDMTTEIKIPDGTKIRAKSNQWGLADIDEVWITPAVTATSRFKSLGYIVQGFCDTAIGAINNQRVTYMVTMPDGQVSGYWDDYLWDDFFPFESINYYSSTPPEFSDNGAKYIPYAYGKDPNTFDWLYEDPPKYQQVSTVDYITPNPLTGAPFYGYSSGGYEFTYGQSNFSYNYILVRRPDKNGVFGDVGISLTGSDFVIEKRGNDNGHGFLFMMPQDTTRRFRNSDAIMTDLHAYWDNRGLGETIGYSGNFGLPCQCQYGNHVVKVSRYNNTVDINKLVVWLLVEDLQEHTRVIIRKTFNDDGWGYVTAGSRDLNRELHIAVGGEFDTVDAFYGTITIAPVA